MNDCTIRYFYYAAFSYLVYIMGERMEDRLEDASVIRIKLSNGLNFTLVGEIASNMISGSEKTKIPLLEYMRRYTRYRNIEYAEIVRRGKAKTTPTEPFQISIDIFFNPHICYGVRNHIRISGKEAERIIQEATKKNMTVEEYLKGPESPYIGVEEVTVA
ncbi:hypothetical protein [Thermoplasma sp.]|uniref:hypothetical protein n=1 Tax=Thermoplasma sp. TaxID=1973142 RepID=UPI0012726860|nr:hypothetical protein [Thermoplasma sp.]KAA8923056.1 MAG: hypothetical protein F6Q11_02375 [Thermoplasma sp.]